MQALHIWGAQEVSPKSALQLPSTWSEEPQKGSPLAKSTKTKNGAEPLISIEMAHALSNPWRFRILMELTTRPMSVSQFIEEVGGEQSNISRRFKQLAEWGYIEVVEEKSGGRRRGGVERIYRSTLTARLDAPSWQGLPHVLRSDISGQVLASYLKRIDEALEAGTFDQEVDRHLSWIPATFDQEALVRLGEHLDEILDLVPELEREALERIERDGGEAIPTTVGLAAFRSPFDPGSKRPD